MHISWRSKIIITTMATVAGAIFITWILNRFFLERYYTASKVDTLASAYTTVENILSKYYVKKNEESADAGLFLFDGAVSLASFKTSDPIDPEVPDSITDPDESIFSPNGMFEYRIGLREITSDNFLTAEDTLALEKLASINNLSIYVLVDYRYYFSTMSTYTRESVLYQKIKSYLDGMNEHSELIEQVDGKYEVTKIRDVRTNMSYLDLFSASSEDGTYILIRSSVESMKYSANLASGFLLHVGIIVLAGTLIIITLATRSFIKPIKQLNCVAKSVARLDFNAKYTGDTRDEIGQLGEAINVMSEQLESTISDLKNANNTLQNDIEQKVQIDEMRKEFLSNVTHELKTPIALISGYAEGLKDCINDDAESREFYCDVIIDESNKMNKMVQKLLTLNRIEFGREIVELERFNISAVIRSVLSSTDVLLKNKEIKLLCDIPEQIDVWADEYMIEEVFTNYLTNAINHCSYDKIIDIKATESVDTVRISVFNTGDPIPEEDIDKIWIKFYKVDKARSREYGGTGIGLSIVKAIMDAHNKPFGVINHANGVEFWFELDLNSCLKR